MKTRLKVGFLFSKGFIIVIFLLSAKGVVLTEGYSTISVFEAKNLVETNTHLFILDVRTESEYKDGHISGAYLIPHTEINERQDELPTNKSQPILVYCRSGIRSVNASLTLESLKYTEIYNMAGGFNQWKITGYPYNGSTNTTGTSLFLALGIMGFLIFLVKKRYLD
jgi:rhodanese-related sulfurtransferase